MKYLIIIITSFIFSTSAMAEIKYFSDPAYIEAGASNPLQSLQNMASKGDARALYMMGDLYEKGKGGYSKNIRKSYAMFVKSAEQNFSHSFIRLAVMEKKRKDYSEAYKWYVLAIKHEKNKVAKRILKANLRELKANMNKSEFKEGKQSLKKWKLGKDYKEAKKTTRPITRKVND